MIKVSILSPVSCLLTSAIAVPEDIYEEFFTRRLAQMSVKRMQLNLLVFNPITEEIVSWK
ncbi:element excision factor XisH family protein [Limnoraphis robusta]|uniref:Element excision factor XisH family protein n=1 Tax=Limnoraphis robusta CCNP1315 TaxID=3110306 RepID=A0ABU5TUG4_9CYAN|nr:element excision factor XisH family protein [Limnoraphis robusta]MEA5517648.1 element excision factor XisH family protein [Limnoraphis robusta CCNP1315]MEA5544467.1 element excision factor XisH family protein [Limnoraphis robusta CCNP1324]